MAHFAIFTAELYIRGQLDTVAINADLVEQVSGSKYGTKVKMVSGDTISLEKNVYEVINGLQAADRYGTSFREAPNIEEDY